MKPTSQLSLHSFTSDRARQEWARKLAFSVARELDNINQGMLHLGLYRKSPAVKIPYDQLYQIYEQSTTGQTTEQLLKAVPKLNLVVPVDNPSRDTLVNGMIALDIWAVRPGIDYYAEHADKLELPFNFDVDRHGLTVIDDSFKLESQGIIYGDDLVYYHPFLRRFFSARFVDVPDSLAAIQKRGDVELKVALDPIRHTKSQFLDRTMEFDYWYGAKFDEHKLSDPSYKGATVHGRNDPNGVMDFTFPLTKTLFYVTNNKEDEKEFQIEELVPTDSKVSADSKYVLHRFAHFIWSNKLQTFRHFDCAVLIYTKAEHAKRIKYDWSQAETADYADTFKRKKLFRLDGNMQLEQVKNLLYAFFRYNELVMEFFGAVPEG